MVYFEGFSDFSRDVIEWCVLGVYRDGIIAIRTTRLAANFVDDTI